MTRVTKSEAVISDNCLYRYSLTRQWDDDLKPLVFIGLNPSTADALVDDPTIRRCMRFARGNGHGGLIMVNLFAWRSTDPKNLHDVDDPVGPENAAALRLICNSNCTVAAWGVENKLMRGQTLPLRCILRGPIYCLGHTKGWYPRHPLYVRADTPLSVYWEYRPV